MPNGGSDCCATCAWNTRNKGETGYAHADSDDPDYCSIRQFQVEDKAKSYWTYCANHSKLPNGSTDVPIGPVFRNNSGLPGNSRREVLLESPDTETVRKNLLLFVEGMSATCSEEFYEPYFKLVILLQLARFGEQRALPHLERIAASAGGHNKVEDPFGIAFSAKWVAIRIRNSRAGETLKKFWFESHSDSDA